MYYINTDIIIWVQFIGNRKLMQRDTSLRATQLKHLGGHVPSPPIPSPVSGQQNCPVAGHELFTSLLTLHTPFFNIMQIIVIVKTCHLKHGFPADSSYQERLFWDIHEMSHPQYKSFKACLPRWKHCCDNNTQVFHLISSYVYSYVAIVTIQEVLLLLPVVISWIESLWTAS